MNEGLPPVGGEWGEAERELQKMAWEALERCHKAGAKADDVILLAKLAGRIGWKPDDRMDSRA